MSISSPRLSVVIVNYKSTAETLRLLTSLYEAEPDLDFEIIVVDNASGEDGQEGIVARFPLVRFIQMKNNIGFGKGCNAAALKAAGEYLLFINPDTLITNGALSASVAFMEKNQECGIMGPKILNSDGTFQRQCRRSFPTPLNAFFYFTGLYRLFPKVKRLGEYTMSWADPDTAGFVDAVSGSFLFIRAPLFHELGGFDPDFFMFGEDLDLCARVKKEGKTVAYNPAIQIVHFKGQSCAHNMIRARIAFYEAMLIFSRKHRHSYGAFFPGWAIGIGVGIITIINIGTILTRHLVPLLIDLLFINFTLFVTTYVRFLYLENPGPYVGDTILMALTLHLFISSVYLAVNVRQGIYTSEKYSVKRVLISGLIASALFFSSLFLFKAIAFSRIAFVLSMIIIPFFLVLWRKILPDTISWIKRKTFITGTVVVAGSSSVTSDVIRTLENDKTAQIAGILWPEEGEHPGEFNGYPVIGTIKAMKTECARTSADLLIITSPENWYSPLIETLAYRRSHKLTVKCVPKEFFEKGEEAQMNTADIPLIDFSL